MATGSMNNIELITTYSTQAWDLVYKQESVLSLLDSKPDLVKFTGAKTVKVAKWQNGGLGNYYRNNNYMGAGDTRVPEAPDGKPWVGAAPFGYQKAAARLVWEEFTLRQDRAAAFQIEEFDNEETGGKTVGLAATEISRTAIVPEVDAYGLSTIASYCTTGLGNLVEETIVSNGTLGEGQRKPLAALNAAFVYFDEHEVPIDDQIAYVSPHMMNALRETDEVTKFLGQQDFTRKDVSFQIVNYQGRDLVLTAPSRLRTNIVLGENGYTWGAGSKAINFLMVSKSAVMHVVKYEKVKIISGDMNLAGQGFDGYTIYARVYHDVFVPDNKRVALYCSAASSVPAPTVKLDVLVDSKDHTIKSITTTPGDKLYFVGTGSKGSGTVAVGDTLTTFTPVAAGAKVTATTEFYAVDSNKKVVAIYKYTYTA